MKTKQDASKILQEAGWTTEEIASVLADNIVVRKREEMPELIEAVGKPLTDHMIEISKPDWSSSGVKKQLVR